MCHYETKILRPPFLEGKAQSLTLSNIKLPGWGHQERISWNWAMKAKSFNLLNNHLSVTYSLLASRQDPGDFPFNGSLNTSHP